MSTDLSRLEATELERHEAVIGRGLDTFIEVGTALMAIRDDRLYRVSHRAFEDYCRERWGISRVHAHRLIESASIVNNLLPIGNTPQTESQARPLARLEPEQQRAAWEDAVASAPNGKPTARHVEDAVARIIPQPEASQRSVPVHAELFVDDEPEPTINGDAPPSKPFRLDPSPPQRTRPNPLAVALHDLSMVLGSVIEHGGPRKMVGSLIAQNAENVCHQIDHIIETLQAWKQELSEESE